MLKGSLPALITPFSDGAVDEEAFQALVEWHVQEGSHGLVPVGTTGESPTLNHEEHKRVVELCVEAAAGRVPVVAGTGSNSTAEAIDFTRHAEAARADAALVVTPYYNKPTQEGLYQHFKAIAECSDLPILVYNVPPRTMTDVLPETLARLANDVANIIGVKDATADLTRPSMHRELVGEEFVQLSGEDGTALGFNAHGGVGCISVTANVVPALCSQFQEACSAGDYRKALKIQDRLMPLHKALFIETSPTPVKYAVSRLGRCKPEPRLPLLSITESGAEAVDKAMRAAGLTNL